MNKQINYILTESALKILRPLVRVMIRNGVPCNSFEEIARKAYVDEAFLMSEKSQQKATISSVAAQTGLSRKEVKRLNEIEDIHNLAIEQKYNRAIRVISGWVNDEDFIDAHGNTRTLAIDGKQNSFSELVKQYSGYLTTIAMVDLLVAADCVEKKGNMVSLIKHAYVPNQNPAEIIKVLGTDTNELLNTIDFNLTAEECDKRYQRKVSTALLDLNAIEQFKELSNRKSQALLEELDAWLSQHEVNQDDEDARYISLGIYYYQQ
jgi:hypothetical protein